jgi:hypothetical protein
MNKQKQLVQALLEDKDPLIAVFILESIRYYSEKIANSSPGEANETDIISPQMWHDAGVYINAAIEQLFNEPTVINLKSSIIFPH